MVQCLLTVFLVHNCVILFELDLAPDFSFFFFFAMTYEKAQAGNSEVPLAIT